MVIEFEVEGQRLTRTSEAFLVEGSEKFVECLFIFSGDWDKLDKWAVFRRDNDTHEICIVEGKCLIPIECTAIDGEFSVHCIGKENNEQVIATTSEKLLTVIPEGVPRTTYFEQVMNNIKTFSRNMIYVGENEPGTSEGDVKIWVNPAEDDDYPENLQVITSGSTEERPTDYIVGMCYFDTTLGKPVWCKEAGVWVDANGTTV